MMKEQPNIDYSLCTGCGGCADAFPRIFEIREEKAWVVHPEAYEPAMRERVMTVCPFYAISIVEA